MSALVSVLVPLSFFICLFGIFWIIFNSRNKNKAEIQLTLRAMIENGQTISPELLDKLTEDKVDRKQKDFRQGLMFIAIAVGTFFIGVFDEGITGDLDDMFDFVGAASFFLCIGIARLLLWKYAPNKDDNKAD